MNEPLVFPPVLPHALALTQRRLEGRLQKPIVVWGKSGVIDAAIIRTTLAQTHSLVRRQVRESVRRQIFRPMADMLPSIGPAADTLSMSWLLLVSGLISTHLYIGGEDSSCNSLTKLIGMPLDSLRFY